ncbi:putative DNA damage inducible protein, partial [Trachipleistophora hominis]
MVNNLIDREEDFINKISGSQLIAGNIVYYDEENAFDTKKEERIEMTRTRARAIKEKIAQFTDNELRYAYKMVQIEKERLIRAWPALFDSDYMLNNVFIYIDIDAFYASVEMIVNPVSGPLAVGSMSMLAAVNYDARKYGIRSGMPGYQGRTLCPSLVIRKCNFELYNIFSERVMGMLAKFDENIEIYGLDECSLVMDEEKMRKGYMYFCEWDRGCECLLNDGLDDFSCNTRTTDSFDSHQNSTENGEKPIGLQEKDAKKMQIKPNETYNDGKKHIDLVSTAATKIEEDVIATKTENEMMNPQNEFFFDTCSQTTKCTREELFSLGNENKIFIKDYNVEDKSYGVKRSLLDRKSALPKINESPGSLLDISVATDATNHLTYENSSHFQICAEHKKKYKIFHSPLRTLNGLSMLFVLILKNTSGLPLVQEYQYAEVYPSYAQR